MPITLIAIGKKHESWVAEGIERYQKRLKQPFTVKWVLMPHSAYDGLRAREEESGRILSAISPQAYVILLDERGKSFDSPAISHLLTIQLDHSKEVVLIIGGAYGVDDKLRERADIIWSLSPLVFPHQLVRLILVEQLYRAQQIVLGGSYHHE